jgi:DNA-binding transcriptional ArsR family regulator
MRQRCMRTVTKATERLPSGFGLTAEERPLGRCSSRALRGLLANLPADRILSFLHPHLMLCLRDVATAPSILCLVCSERSVGDLESAPNLSRPLPSKRLSVLRDAGFVAASNDAQGRAYRIQPEPLHGVGA